MHNYEQLQKNLNYRFKDINLLKQALTHRSFARQNNERLEFLGDGILDCVIALNLYKLYPECNEGQLSKMRAAMVNQDTLLLIGDKLRIKQYLLLGDGEIKSGGYDRPSIIADGVEAIFAAVYLDSDFITVSELIKYLFKDMLANQQLNQIKDYKTQLQELLQAQQMNLPIYEVVTKLGHEHDLVFTVKCSVKELNLSATGIGKSKKQASQMCALELLNIIQKEN